MKKDVLLKIDKLGIGLINKESDNTLLNNISFDIPKNKIVGLVGESGSGKSLTALSILRLLNSKIYNTSGKIIFNNKNILELNLDEVQRIRGKEIAMIFQEPMSALNPTMTIGNQLIEICNRHLDLNHNEIIKRIHDLIAEKSSAIDELQKEKDLMEV